jgi:DNA-binding MarR family transcriptional regulator
MLESGAGRGVDMKRRTVSSAMRQSPPPFPAMDELSGDEDAILRFLRIQLLQQASHAQVAENNRYLRAEMQHDANGARAVLERLADRGYVERRTGRFARDGARTYAYRLTEAGEEALRRPN